MDSGSRYDDIGRTYTRTRGEDPRIAAAIRAALGDARTVLNVGAGAGAYEPPDLELVAVEPSEVMIAQRPAGSAPVVRASAESLPFEDGSFDAAMAILSDHHWRDRSAGIRELRRVARRRVVLLNVDPALFDRFWFTTEYLPEFADLIPEPHREPGSWERELRELLGPVELIGVPIPHDCRDGFFGAYWRRPHAYLDSEIRSGISVFSLVPAAAVERAVAALARDLDSGEWEHRHRDLLELDEIELGYRLAVAELG
ncbi:MAG TPA: class I SAM-dependent methyltransferase [Thermoleophilaceae bacterium]|nr:class I SAM-dependent methyltransferase [Thermoleophilaceae bacterium]